MARFSSISQDQDQGEGNEDGCCALHDLCPRITSIADGTAQMSLVTTGVRSLRIAGRQVIISFVFPYYEKETVLSHESHGRA